ncbi:hypothetical protein [Halocatena marina]|uniref:hypothetical protein n=1 Tax=Halocatena marina TaxID=2934937 RepID=UPI00201067C0|nr:hypothetical protein [Halocatena marina]
MTSTLATTTSNSGNIHETLLAAMLDSDGQHEFGEYKRDSFLNPLLPPEEINIDNKFSETYG